MSYWSRIVAGLAAFRPGGLARVLVWLAMYALGRIVVVRRIVRTFARTGRRRTALASPSMFDASVDALAESLRRDGFDARLRLPPAVAGGLASLGEEVSATLPYLQSGHPSYPAIDRIAGDATLLALADVYLGRSAIYRGSRVWWTRPGLQADPTETGERFHYDLYDYQALTVLIYLTDVDPDAGPHVCVRASHRLRTWKDQLHPRRHRSDENVIRSYGESRIVTICGPAGTVIAEDPFCFHKIKLPARRARLAAQLLYTGNAFPVPSFDRATPTALGGRPR